MHTRTVGLQVHATLGGRRYLAVHCDAHPSSSSSTWPQSSSTRQKTCLSIAGLSTMSLPSLADDCLTRSRKFLEASQHAQGSSPTPQSASMTRLCNRYVGVCLCTWVPSIREVSRGVQAPLHDHKNLHAHSLWEMLHEGGIHVPGK